MKNFNLFKIILLFICFQIIGVFQCTSDLEKDLPGNYQYIDEGGDYKYIDGGKKNIHIHATIIGYEYNNNFIIMIQKPIKICPCSVDTTFADSLLFWIIDIKKDSVYGGLKTNEYFRIRKELSIPENLKVNVDL